MMGSSWLDKPGYIIVFSLGALLFKDGVIYRLSKLEFTVCLVIAVVIVLVCRLESDDDGRW